MPPFQKNGFVVACPVARHGVIIDPGDEVDQLLQWTAAEQIEVEHILLTHAHVDHVTGVGIARAALHVPVWLHRDDARIYDRALEQARRFGLTLDAPLPPVDRWYADGDELAVGTLRIRPLHTPGHCPGGVCLAVTQEGVSGEDLFVGDTLFAGTVGRTDLPGGDSATLIDAIRRVLLSFPDEARVHPGHGPSTTIGHERRTNPYLQLR